MLRAEINIGLSYSPLWDNIYYPFIRLFKQSYGNKKKAAGKNKKLSSKD